MLLLARTLLQEPKAKLLVFELTPANGGIINGGCVWLTAMLETNTSYALAVYFRGVPGPRQRARLCA